MISPEECCEVSLETPCGRPVTVPSATIPAPRPRRPPGTGHANGKTQHDRRRHCSSASESNAERSPPRRLSEDFADRRGQPRFGPAPSSSHPQRFAAADRLTPGQLSFRADARLGIPEPSPRAYPAWAEALILLTAPKSATARRRSHLPNVTAPFKAVDDGISGAVQRMRKIPLSYQS